MIYRTKFKTSYYDDQDRMVDVYNVLGPDELPVCTASVLFFGDDTLRVSVRDNFKDFEGWVTTWNMVEEYIFDHAKVPCLTT